MADLIDRQAAIDALAKHEKSNGHNYTFRGGTYTSTVYDTETKAAKEWNKRAECDAEMRGEEDG